MSLSSSTFATDDRRNRLIPARLTDSGAAYVQHALNYGKAKAAKSDDFHAGVETFEDYGFLPSMLEDPGRDFTPWKNNQFTIQVHAYQYFGGMEWWNNLPGSSSTKVDGLSPVTLDDMDAGITVVADHAIMESPTIPWGQATQKQFVDSPAHGLSGSGEPKGGNHIFGDGSGQWIDFADYLQLHTWDRPRVAYYYQEDLGDYTPPSP